MSRSRNHLPKYRKHRASGQAVVTLNGRDYYLGPHGTKASKIEYDRMIAEWLASGRSSSFGLPGHSITIVELSADYLKHAKDYYGGGTRGTYSTMVRVVRLLTELYGRSIVVEFEVLQFKAIRQKMIDANLSRGYINDTMSRVVGVFRWGAGEGRIPASVAQNLAAIPGLRKGRGVARETPPIKPVELADIDATLPNLSTVVASMVRFQLLTGARPGEVCILRPELIDHSGSVWEAKLCEHKTAHFGRNRIILIGPRAQDVLRPFLLRSSDAYCFSPAEAAAQIRALRSANRKTPLSCGNSPGKKKLRSPKRSPGERYTTQSFGVAIARAC